MTVFEGTTFAVSIVVMCDNFIGVGVAAITAALEVFRNVISFFYNFYEGKLK